MVNSRWHHHVKTILSCRKPICRRNQAKVVFRVVPEMKRKFLWCRKPVCRRLGCRVKRGPAKFLQCRKQHCAEALSSCEAGPAALQLVTFDFAGNKVIFELKKWKNKFFGWSHREKWKKISPPHLKWHKKIGFFGHVT